MLACLLLLLHGVHLPIAYQFAAGGAENKALRRRRGSVGVWEYERRCPVASVRFGCHLLPLPYWFRLIGVQLPEMSSKVGAVASCHVVGKFGFLGCKAKKKCVVCQDCMCVSCWLLLLLAVSHDFISLTAYGHEWPTERSNQFHLPTQHSTTYSPPSSVWLLISSDTDRFRRCHYCSLRHHSCYHHRVSVTVDEQMCVSLPVLSISIVPIYRVITVPYHSVLVASWSVYYHRVPTTTTTITVGVHVLEVWRSSVTMGLDPSWPLLTLQNRYLHRY